MTTYEHLLEPHELAELGHREGDPLPLDLVDPNPRNPRKALPEVDTLADNIRTFGLLQPVTVRRAGDRYELLGGHRRHAAYTLLREQEPHNPAWRAIPAVVRTADDDTAELMLISSQVHTRAWRPREEAYALERLLLGGRTVSEVGEVLNRTPSWASKRLRVYSDSVLSGYVQSGRLTPTVAEEFLTILDPASKQDLAERAAAEGWSQDHARGHARALRLDRQLREVGKQARSLLELLSSIDASRLPPAAAKDLLVLSRRIVAMAKTGGPVIPSIESAQRAAGVKTQDKPEKRGRPRKAGYRPKI